MPVSRPGELAEAGDRAGLGHARQAEIEPVGEEARHENAGVGNLGNKRDQSSRRPFTDAQGTPGIAEVAKHQRVAEAAVIASTAPDRGDIRLGQCIVAHQLTWICNWIE